MRTLILSLVLLAVTNPGFAQATGPDGFGPIKFGMTKAEAWEAIGGEGEWYGEGDTHIRYELEIDLISYTTQTVEVRQAFRQEKAHKVGVHMKFFTRTNNNCISPSLYIASYLQSMYQVAPLTRESVIALGEDFAKDIYVFTYANGASIEIHSVAKGSDLFCHVLMYYRPPQSEKLPF